MSGVEFRKIQAFDDESSYFLGLPKSFITELGVSKGDYMRCSQEGKKIVIEPVKR
jgi:antitoxin component of MazEF toxin-antitoxin module